MNRRIDQPRPGYFKRRIWKGGPWVPFEIRREGNAWMCIRNGIHFMPHEDAYKAEQVMETWQCGHEITKEEHDALLNSGERKPF